MKISFSIFWKDDISKSLKKQKKKKKKEKRTNVHNSALKLELWKRNVSEEIYIKKRVLK